MVKQYVPDRRDVVWIDLNPTRGHEQAKVRPAVVISPKAYNRKVGLALICPVTSVAKGYPFEVPVKVKDVKGVVLADQVRSLAWAERSVQYVGKMPDTAFSEVTERLKLIIAC